LVPSYDSMFLRNCESRFVLEPLTLVALPVIRDLIMIPTVPLYKRVRNLQSYNLLILKI